MKKLGIILGLPFRALRVLVLEGPSATWRKVRSFLINKNHYLGEVTNQKVSNYNTFSGYLRHSVLFPTIRALQSEEALYVLGYMDMLRKLKVSIYARRSQDQLVSIIMPTYNRAHYIKYALESVLAQRYENWELLITDDGSTDNTEDLVKQYADPRIKYQRCQENRGPSSARNSSLAMAAGDYICYLDSDNRIHPDFILIMLNELIDNPGFDAVYCAQELIFDDRDNSAERKAVRFGLFNRSLLENSNYIDMGMLMHRQSLVEEYGQFNDDMQRLVDWEYILRITADKAPKALPCLLSSYYYYNDTDQVTFSASLDQAYEHVDRLLARDPLTGEMSGWAGVPELKAMFSPLAVPRVKKSRPVTIIIPNFECLKYLQLCLASIETYTTGDNYKIIIVDNGSGQEIDDFLAEISLKQNVEVIKNNRNYGFTYAVNQGLAAADSEWDLVLLNNDAVVTRNWLEGLQEVFEQVEDAALAVPRQTLLPYTKTMKVHCPETADYREVDVNLSSHHDNIINPLLHESLGLMELNFAPFFCVYLSREIIDQLGPLDLENGPHYRSDRLYCEATRLICGKKIVYTPRSKVYHLLQKSTDHLKNTNNKMYQDMFVHNCWHKVESSTG